MSQKPTYQDLEQRIRELEEQAVRGKEAEDRITRTLESIQDGFYSVDAEWRFVYVNAVAARIMGIKRDKVIGKSVWEVFPFLQGTRMEGEYRRAAAGEVSDFENYYTPWDRWYYSVCYPRPGGGVSVYARDITEQKQLRETLLESEKRFRAIADYAPDWEIWIGPEGKVLWLNPMVLDFTGYTVKECFNMDGFPMVLVDEADRERMRGFFMDAVQRESRGSNVECRIVCKNGIKKWVSVSWQPMYDDSGTHQGHRANLRDITSLKRAEEALKKAHDELERRVQERTAELAKAVQSLTEKEQLLAVESHRLQETNTALKVLLEHREKERHVLETQVVNNVKRLVLPYVEKLKLSPLAPVQTAYLNVIAANLENIVSPFLRNLTTSFMNFTPREIEVASLVREGKSAKEIALLLNSSIRSIESHMNHIRKKLGIINTKKNLRTYLLTLGNPPY